VRDAPLDGCGIAIRSLLQVLGSILAILIPPGGGPWIVALWLWLNGRILA